MKYTLLILLSFVALLAGCKKKDNEKDLTGTWAEKAITTKFTGTTHWITFNEDMTFQMKLNHFTDATEPGPTPCSGNRVDYVMGTYSAANNKITFTGKYCDEGFNQYQPNCEGTATFDEMYTTTYQGKDLVLDYEKEDPYKIWLVKQ
jgi:hypothetical protein